MSERIREVLSQDLVDAPGPARPHGGVLVQRGVDAGERDAVLRRAREWPAVTLDRAQASDLELLAVGAYSPLTGFLGRADHDAVVGELRLADGTPWPIPIDLPVDAAAARVLAPGAPVALRHGRRILGVLELQDIYPYDRRTCAGEVYRTTSPEHPGVARVLAAGELLLAGPVRLLERPSIEFPRHHLDPLDVRRRIAARGWSSVVAFQTRNPIHRAHEFIQKAALEIVEGLLVHPLVGETQAGDLPADVRMRSYEVLLEGYYPPARTLLAVLPAAMRYAGPREAVFHALVRKNYGCTHFIVGRDHAGVGGFYGPHDAQRIFAAFPPGELGIQPLCFENAFWCRDCVGMASLKTCPHPDGSHLVLSGTRVREMLRAGLTPPPEFTRPEVARVLIDSLAAS